MARKDGYWAGWHTHRHGSPKPPPSKAIYRGEKRKHMLYLVINMLSDWRLTPFENEGPAVHALRQAFILGGHGWQQSHSEAQTLVREGLGRLGAARPSWDQGQRQYTIPPENCNWCARPLPDEMVSGRRAGRFCSSMCARSALEHRTFETRWKDSAIGRSAFEIVMRETLPQLTCEGCGTKFRKFNRTNRDQRFCSFECSREALRTLPVQICDTCETPFRPSIAGRKFCSVKCVRERTLPAKPCLQCQRDFVPKSEQALYCSKSCLMRSKRVRNCEAAGTVYKPSGTIFNHTCRSCGDPFKALSPKAHFCDAMCMQTFNRIKGGYRLPRRLSPKVFDCIMQLAA